MKVKTSDRIYSGASPEQVENDLRPLVEFQDAGLPLESLRDMIERRLVPHLAKYDTSGFQALFNAFPELEKHGTNGVFCFFLSPTQT